MVIWTIKIFLYSSVFSWHLFISYASVRSLPFLSFIVPILAWNIPLISPIFLKRFLVFPILLLSSISLHCSLKKVLLGAGKADVSLKADSHLPFNPRKSRKQELLWTDGGGYMQKWHSHLWQTSWNWSLVVWWCHLDCFKYSSVVSTSLRPHGL